MDPLVEAAHRAWGDTARKALHTTAEKVLEQGRQDAPHLQGKLAEEGHLDEMKVGAGGSISIDIVFPGPYARKQHEHLEYKHPHGGKAKFLEHAVQNAHLLEHLAEA